MVLRLTLLLLLHTALLALLRPLQVVRGFRLLVLSLLLRREDAQDLLAQLLQSLAIARASFGMRLGE